MSRTAEPQSARRVPPVRRLGGGSFVARLVVLCLVPVLGLLWLGTIRLGELEDAVDEAEFVVLNAKMSRNVNAISQAANSERLALSGLVMADRMGVPRDLVVELSGIDFEAMFFDEQSRLDLELDELTGRLAEIDGREAGGLRIRVEQARAELERQRARSERGEGDQDGITAVFDRIDKITLDARELVGFRESEASLVVTAGARLDALLEVVQSANVYASAIMDGLIGFDLEKLVALERAGAVHETRLDAFEQLLIDAETQTSVAELRASFAEVTRPVDEVVGTVPLAASPDPRLVTVAAAPLVGFFDYLKALGRYAEIQQQEIVDEAQSLAAQIRSDAAQTQLVMYAIGASTLALIVVVAVSTVAPLRRLGRRAEAIGAGELALEPLPIRGPGIVRTLTATVNDMLSTLHLVDRQIAGMAAGTTEHDSQEIPGTIGDSLRHSVDHLARVTASWQRSERRASAIVEQAADAIWAIDGDGIIRTANEASEQLLQVPTGEQVGRALADFLPTLEGETPVVGRPEVRVHVASSVADANHLVTVIARDLSERFRFEEQLAHQARHDALTELPNRFAVLERLEELYAADESVAVLFIDIDGFKGVNDTRGHAAGDRVLAEIGRRLADHVRPQDYVARLGGDEFVVLARGVRHVADAEPFGRRLIAEIERPYIEADSTFALSASIGVAIMDRSVPALETVRRADNAVYVAKRHGRGRVEAFDAQLQASIEHDADLALALRDAIRADELLLHYQPIIDLSTDRICGVEALVRWDRPGIGLIPPDDFIPVAERSSLIVDLQRWVLREASATVAEWGRRHPGFDKTVAVNISGRHLVDGDLAADIDAVVEQTGVDPRALVLELTETQLLEDVDRAIAVLDELRGRGITISVDDFGTGYSSMTYLRDLPIDAIKIDRTFLANALADGQDEPLVDAMLTIGRSLDLAVVAEGVETEQQLTYVSERGCGFAQGFLFSPPLPTAEVEALLFDALITTR